jgi:hypothetical protein
MLMSHTDLLRRLRTFEELIRGYERQLGISDDEATRTIGSEIERLLAIEDAAKWVLNDIRYKAPEQCDAEMAQRWSERLKEALPDEEQSRG